MDTKKRELVGNFANKGVEWHPKGMAESVSAYEQVEGAGITPPENRKYGDCKNFTDYYNLLENLNRNIYLGYYNDQTFYLYTHKNPYNILHWSCNNNAFM